METLRKQLQQNSPIRTNAPFPKCIIRFQWSLSHFKFMGKDLHTIKMLFKAQEDPGRFGLSAPVWAWLKQLDHSSELAPHLWLTRLNKSLKWADAVEKHIQLHCLDKERAARGQTEEQRQRGSETWASDCDSWCVWRSHGSWCSVRRSMCLWTG